MAVDPYADLLPPPSGVGVSDDGFDLMDLAGGAMSGIGYAAGVLDKPGRVVRGLLGGKPRELLNVVPFSDTFGLTKPSDAVSGNDLLGIKPHGFIENIPGFAMEVALDPLTYLGGVGLLGKAGKAGTAVKRLGFGDEILEAGARKLGPGTGRRRSLQAVKLSDMPEKVQSKVRGVLGDTDFAKYYDKPLGGMMSLELPFTGKSATFGTGAAATKLAGGLDLLGSKAVKSAPIRRTRQLFDNSVGGFSKPFEQEIATGSHIYGTAGTREAIIEAEKVRGMIKDAGKDFDAHFGKEIRALPDIEKGGIAKRGYRFADDLTPAEKKARQKVFEHNEAVLSNKKKGKLIPTEDVVDTALDKVLRLAGELPKSTARPPLRHALDEILPGSLKKANVPVELEQKLNKIIESFRVAKDGYYDLAKKKGMFGEVLDNFMIKHVPRYLNLAAAKKVGLHPRKLISTSGPASMGRDPLTRSVPTEIINRIIRDPLARGKKGVAHVEKTYGEYLWPDTAPGNIADAQQELSKTVEGVVPKLPTDAAGTSRTQAAADLVAYAEDHAGFGRANTDMFSNDLADDIGRYYTSVKTSLASLDSVHTTLGRNVLPKGKGGVSISRVFADAGMDADAATKYFEETFKHGPDAKVTQEVADAVKAVLRPSIDKQWAEEVGGMIDDVTNMWKKNVTVPFAGFWVRNFTAGQYMNMVSGEIRTPADIKDYISNFREVRSYMKSGNIPDELARELKVYNVYDPSHGFMDVPLHETEDFLPPKSFDMRENYRYASEQARNLVPSKLDKYLAKVPGAQRVKQTAKNVGYTAMETGTRATQNVEFLNRVPMYTYLRKKGFSAGEASKRVLELQVDWKDMSDFERKVMKRLVPFYSFTRKIAPTQVKILLDRPGGAFGQTFRAMNTLRGTEGQLVPDYISQTAAIPWGEAKDGRQRFMTGFGLPQEDSFGLFRKGATSYHTAQGTLEEMFGRLSPLVKVPMEMVAGKQFFSGRNLEDLRGTLSDLAYNAGITEKPAKTPILLEQLASNSPAARYLSTARTALDPRKHDSLATLPLQLGTGIRFTDADLERAQKQLYRDWFIDTYRSDPDFNAMEKIYPKRGAELDARTQSLWDRFNDR